MLKSQGVGGADHLQARNLKITEFVGAYLVDDSSPRNL